VAHISVQRKIDSDVDEKSEPTSVSYSRWLHYEFCSHLPKELLLIEDPKTKKKIPIVPGEFRTRTVESGPSTLMAITSHERGLRICGLPVRRHCGAIPRRQTTRPPPRALHQVFSKKCKSAMS